MKRLLIRMTAAPYAGLRASDALDFAFASVNFGHQPVLLFEADGVRQLVKGQSVPVGMRNHEKRVKACGLYDIDELYVAQESLSALNIVSNDLVPDIVVLNEDDITKLVSTCDHHITF